MSAKASSSTWKLSRVKNVVLLEDDAVVDAVEAAAGGDEILPGRAFVAEAGRPGARLDAFVFEKADEDEAVEGALGHFGERFAVEIGIVVLEGAGRAVAVFVEFSRKDSSMLW